MITFDDVKQNDKVTTLISTADAQLGVVGYTEHGFRHASIVSSRASKMLAQLGKDKRIIELAQIAGYMHDIGNSVNREDHARTGALLAYNLLLEMGMPIAEVAEIIAAVGNHHEVHGLPVSDIAAALIIADKSDVHHSRVRKTGDVEHDIHDRVNFAVKKTNVMIRTEESVLELSVIIDTEIATLMQYFETFLVRMVLCRKAAEYLKLKFELIINGVRLS